MPRGLVTTTYFTLVLHLLLLLVAGFSVILLETNASQFSQKKIVNIFSKGKMLRKRFPFLALKNLQVWFQGVL